MKTFDDVDKVLCRYHHFGGGVAIEHDVNDEMTLALCFGYEMPYVVIIRHETGYTIRKYTECPKKYAGMLYEI